MSSDNFFSEVLCSGLIIISNRFQPPISRFETQYLLTRLVKAEIVSPYCGVLINMNLGLDRGNLARNRT